MDGVEGLEGGHPRERPAAAAHALVLDRGEVGAPVYGYLWGRGGVGGVKGRGSGFSGGGMSINI